MAYVDGFRCPRSNGERLKPSQAGEQGRQDLERARRAQFPRICRRRRQEGKVTSFPRSVKLKPSETVVFSWIVYKSRKDRDRVNAKVMKDKRIAGMEMSAMPFDGKRMIYGGFKKLVEA